MTPFTQQMMAAMLLPAAMTAEMMARTGSIMSRHMSDMLGRVGSDEDQTIETASIEHSAGPTVGTLATPVGSLPA